MFCFELVSPDCLGVQIVEAELQLIQTGFSADASMCIPIVYKMYSIEPIYLWVIT